jgi:hypothetical protein
MAKANGTKPSGRIFQVFKLARTGMGEAYRFNMVGVNRDKNNPVTDSEFCIEVFVKDDMLPGGTSIRLLRQIADKMEADLKGTTLPTANKEEVNAIAEDIFKHDPEGYTALMKAAFEHDPKV